MISEGYTYYLLLTTYYLLLTTYYFSPFPILHPNEKTLGRRSANGK